MKPALCLPTRPARALAPHPRPCTCHSTKCRCHSPRVSLSTRLHGHADHGDGRWWRLPQVQTNSNHSHTSNAEIKQRLTTAVNGRRVLVVQMELLSLSDDILANVAEHLGDVSYICSFLQTCTRAWATSAHITRLGGMMGGKFKTSQMARYLVPASWSGRFANLTHLSMFNLTASGMARLVAHLHLWPRLTVMVIGAPLEEQLVDIVEDRALALRNGFLQLPELRHLDLECQGRPYFGPDASLVAALPPTARLWWMAERPQYVRSRKLDLWRTTAEQSDLLWEQEF